ncbi:MAG: hypothetical protein ACLGIG_00265 [Actinomycetes bacterium]
MTHPLLVLEEHHRRTAELQEAAERDRLARSVRPPLRTRLPRLRVTVQVVRPLPR